MYFWLVLTTFTYISSMYMGVSEGHSSLPREVCSFVTSGFVTKSRFKSDRGSRCCLIVLYLGKKVSFRYLFN